MAWTTPKTWAFQEGVESSELNTHLRDNQLAMGPHLIVRKTGDESVVSSNVQQPDNDLILPVAANEIWKTEWHLIVDVGPGGMDVRWTFPTGGYLSFSLSAPSSNALNPIGTGTSPTADHTLLSAESTGTRYSYVWTGVYVNGGTGGNVGLEWAQNISNGTGAVMKANSTLWAVKLA